MRRVAVYAGTRNIYHLMAVAAKSLLKHTRVDRVVFLVEDDEFPEWLPPVIELINVSGQTIFKADGPNFSSKWTYMTMMRLALAEILPDESRCLWLDIDTIVNGDISELFEMDLAGNTFAMVEEPGRSQSPWIYYNAGVLLMDLDRMRTGLSADLIRIVNTRKLRFVDQDVLNLRCQDEILTISPIWNSSLWTAKAADARIIHYAAEKDYFVRSEWKDYEAMNWEGESCQL